MDNDSQKIYNGKNYHSVICLAHTIIWTPQDSLDCLLMSVQLNLTRRNAHGVAFYRRERSLATFRSSKKMPIHRWYPYVEGFSSDYLRGLLSASIAPISKVYDPFAGCGTTLVEASREGIRSYFSETNPFMCFVAQTKVNASIKAKANWTWSKNILYQYLAKLRSSEFGKLADLTSLDSYRRAFLGRRFFESPHLRQLLAAKALAREISDEHEEIRDLLLLAIASVTVACSNMARRADLRRRRPDEYKGRIVNVVNSISEKVREIMDDIEQTSLLARTSMACYDVRTLPDQYADAFDLAITSPPYLNGTNYTRNTKLELWLLDYIKSEKDLPSLRSNVVPSGITEVYEGPKSGQTLQHPLELGSIHFD